MMRILVVAGDGPQRETLLDVLQADGHRVRAVDDGLSAIMEVLRSSPELIVLDRDLEDLEGIDVLERLRRLSGRRNLPVLLIGPSRPSLPDHATRFLPKPVNRADLLQMVRDMLAVPVA